MSPRETGEFFLWPYNLHLQGHQGIFSPVGNQDVEPVVQILKNPGSNLRRSDKAQT
jgi:hypothetical protein